MKFPWRYGEVFADGCVGEVVVDLSARYVMLELLSWMIIVSR